MQHVIALHLAETSMGVRWCHGIPVAYVDITRGVRIHGQLVPLRARIFVVDLVELILSPFSLPFGIYGLGIPAEL